MVDGSGDPDLAAFIDRVLEVDLEDVATAKEVEALCRRAIEIFSEEPSLVEVPAPAYIIGGLDGCIIDTYRSIENYISQGPEYTCIFLGDYTGDECCGGYSLKSLLTALAAKCHSPSHFVMLRGKQETPQADQTDLLDDLLDEYGDEAPMLLDLINYMYTTMPLAAQVAVIILCVSGGISPHLDSLDDIRNIKRPSAEMSNLEIDLIWGAPRKRMPSFTPNPEIEGSHFFGEAAIESACERLGLRLIVCSEQNSYNGLRSFAKTKLIQIYTRSGQDTFGVAMKINNVGGVGFVTFTRHLRAVPGMRDHINKGIKDALEEDEKVPKREKPILVRAADRE